MGRLNGKGRERIRGYNPREIERNIGNLNGTSGKGRDDGKLNGTSGKERDDGNLYGASRKGRDDGEWNETSERNETQEGNGVRISQKESKV